MNFGAPIAIAFWAFILLVGIHEWWISRKHRLWRESQITAEERLALAILASEAWPVEDCDDHLYVPVDWSER